MMTVETSPIDGIDPQSCTLLIVDDEPASLATATEHLAGYGFHIKITQTGETGLELARLVQPDLILLDVLLPGIDGFETCRRLKADERTREIPVIFMTIVTKTEDKVRGFEIGGVDYITKPFQQEEVLARVAAHLRMRDLTRRLEEAKESLERRVEERTATLAQANQELQTEIAERKQEQAKLAEERALLRCLIDSVSDLIFIKDRNGVYQGCNKAGEAFIGMPESEQIGKSDFDFFDREKAEEIRQADRQVLEGKPLRIEEWVTDQDGRRLLMDTLKAPYYAPDGEILGIVGIGRDITKRKRAEQERLVHLWFMESMDQINRAIQSTNDLEQMMSDVLDVVLSVFECDRARFVYPCDPEAATWRAPMERTRSEYPGALIPNLEIPVDSDVVRIYRTVLALDDPVGFGPGNEQPLPAAVAEKFNEQSQLAMAVYPKVDKPYMFGIHQCSRPRVWTQKERRLFKEIGRRLENVLTSLLMYRNLQESEQRYRLVFENSPVSSWEEDFSAVNTLFDDLKNKGITDIETYFDQEPQAVQRCAELTRIVDVNRATLVMHGAASKEELLTGLVNTFTPESFDTFRQALVCLWNGEKEMISDAVVQTLAGESRNVTVYFSVCPGYEETLSKVLVSLPDITERKQAEEALREKQNQLLEAQRIAHIGNWWHDLVSGEIYWSDEFYRIIGREPQQPTAELAVAIAHPDDWHIVQRAMDEAAAGRVEHEHEFRIIRPDGGVRWIHNRWVGIYDEAGKEIKRIGTHQDITERKQAEEAYRASVSRFTELFNKAAIPLCFTSKERDTLHFNAHFEKTFGYSHEEVPTINEWWQLAYPDPVYREWVIDTCYAAIQRAVETGSNIEPIEYRVTCKNGDVRTMVVYGSFVGDELLLTFFDITERKQAEQERLAHLRFLESMDQVNRAIQGTNDLEQMMSDVLDAVLSMFDCDRAFLMYPCDPDAVTWRVPMERNKPEYPGAQELGLEMAMDAKVAETLRLLLATDGPVKFGPGTPHPLPADVAEQFGFKSFMSMALHPKVGKPWQFGIHQCSYPRVWTPEEERLLQEVGRRLSDALTSLLTHQELQRSEERLRLTLEAAQIGIWDWDIPHDHWYASPTYYTMLGYEPKEGLADRSEWLERLHPDDRDMVYAKIQRVLARDFQEYRYEARIRHADGAYRWVSVVGFETQRDQDDQVTRMLGVRMDITDRKRAEEELKTHRDRLEDLVRERTAELTIAKDTAEEARRLAEAASRAKSAFLAQMSHELRTPLNAILGYAQILQRRPLDSDVITALNTVQRSGEHLLTLINDVLDIARIEAGRLELFPTPIHFPGFLDHVASIIRARAEAKGLTFTFEKLGAIPVGVQADETRLRQVLLNLLDNAVKFTDAGHVTLRVRQISGVQPKIAPSRQEGTGTVRPFTGLPTCLRFEVEDTGIGIPSDQVERIFRPFEQVEHATRWTGGTGLGLAISHQLVHLMGGDLRVESQVDRGSTFWFEIVLPVTEMAMEAVQPPERTITGYQGPRRTVLVVDDVPSSRAILVDLLQPLGFEVVEAVDGQQALHLAQELRPDLILMDRWMPVLDGFEAAQRMRQIPELREASIVTVSASVSKEDQEQSREVGIDAFLPKPVSWPRLATLLQECLALEWEYEKTTEVGGKEGEAILVPPPAEEMEILLDLARRGDMRAIRERAVYIETLGEQYVPFARKLRELARGFEERQIRALIEQNMTDDTTRQ